MKRERDIDGDIDRRRRVRGDEAVADLATGQHGVASRGQLERLGLTGAAIDGRVKARRLHVLHPGVYAVGHRNVGRKGRMLAAVLACREGSVLSHRSAAELWGLRQAHRGPVEVTTPTPRRDTQGIRTFSSLLPFDEVTERDRIPVTTVARTLLDLGRVVSADQVAWALNEADVLRLADATPLAGLLDRYPRRRGTAAIRRLVNERQAGDRITHSEMERLFFAFIAKHRLPQPVMNGWVGGFEVDAHWPAARLAVELDSRSFHLTPRAFEADRERDRILTLAGWRVVRVTYRQLTRQGARLAGDLGRLLANATSTAI